MTTHPAAEPRWLDAQEQGIWRAYLDMTNRLTAQLNREMQAKAGISLADYAVLVMLSEQPAHALRAGDLAVALGWEKSRLSHQLTRMQRRTLLDRQLCAEDRRGAVFVLTELGLRTVRDAAADHVDAVRTYLFDLATPEALAGFGDVVRAVVTRLDDVCPSAEAACDGATDDGCGPDLPEPATSGE